MICIIEGPDGTGKTTLARWLEAKMGFTYFKSSIKPLQGMDHRVGTISDRNVLELALDTGKDIVFDRFFPSQLVYDSYYDREVDEDGIFAMDELCGQNTVGVLLYHDKGADLSKRLLDDEIPHNHIWDIQELFFEYEKKSKMTWLSVSSGIDASAVAMCVARVITGNRLDRDTVYMNLAREMSRRSTCLSRRNGGVLVSQSGHVIATAYNGPPCGFIAPTSCARMQAGTSSGQMLDACVDVHSEENLLAQAASQGASTRGSTCYTMASPCTRCARMLINAGISKVVYSELYGDDALEILKTGKIKVMKL
jgi:dCMP deaminase